MYEFKLPDIGEGVTEGEIVKWHVKEGDAIQKDQEMVEVMTDKVTVKIPSPVEGIVTKIMFGEGKIVEVGKSLLQIDTGKAEEAVPVPEKAEVVPEKEELAEEVAIEVEPGRRILASPAIRRIAREKGINLAEIQATGPNGRVTLQDLEEFEKRPAPSEAPIEAVEEKKIEAPEKKPVELRPAKMEKYGEDEVLEPRGLRRLIFERMTKSKSVMPHFTIMEEVDVTSLRESIEKLRKNELKVTFTPFFVKAATVALKEYPFLNAVYDEEKKNYILRKSYNIGIAIDTPQGLTVAVVKDADRKSIVEISGIVSDLASRARSGDLKLDEVQNSTFTVSNVGTIGGLMSTPIINYPEVAILGVHRIQKKVQPNGSIRDMMYLSLSCDHRLIDGATAARFITRLKSILEDPVVFLAQ